MATSAMRRVTFVAGLAWLVVGAVAVRSAFVDDGEGWEVSYSILMVALLVGAAFSVVVAESLSRLGTRRRLRIVGLIVSGLGVVASMVAWALPLWMTTLAVGLAILAGSAPPLQRRVLVLLAGAHVAGIAVLAAGIAAEIGRRDEWGDYPVAHGTAVGVTATITILALLDSTRILEGRSGRGRNALAAS